MTPATTWSEDQTFKFCMEIILAGGPGGKTWTTIAEKWGKPHTNGSLSMKWNRMKAKYEKMAENESGGTDSMKTTPGSKRKGEWDVPGTTGKKTVKREVKKEMVKDKQEAEDDSVKEEVEDDRIKEEVLYFE